jgi:hypothetical protein
LKIGDYELPSWKVYVLAAVWIGCWGFATAVRPAVLALGTTNPAVVRRAEWSMLGLRCKVWAGTELGARRVRFYTFAGRQACKDLSVNSAVKLRLLKAGPVYWVQLDKDYDYWRTQVFLALLGFILSSAPLAALIWWFTRPRVKAMSVQELREYLNKL